MKTFTSWMETNAWRYYFYEEVLELAIDTEVKKALCQQVMNSKTPEEACTILEAYAANRAPRKETIQ